VAHVRIKIIVACVVLAGALAYLTFAGVKDGWVYYLEVDAFLDKAEVHAQRVRLCGRVEEENMHASPAQLTASFDLRGQTRHIPVVYRGAIPDTFKAGCDVVLEGKLDAGGVFQADFMMTKCASKYQAEEHAKRLEEKK
jgi:cytochrome c-type biogenesis protein CcmE